MDGGKWRAMPSRSPLQHWSTPSLSFWACVLMTYPELLSAKGSCLILGWLLSSDWAMGDFKGPAPQLEMTQLWKATPVPELPGGSAETSVTSCWLNVFLCPAMLSSLPYRCYSALLYTSSVHRPQTVFLGEPNLQQSHEPWFQYL